MFLNDWKDGGISEMMNDFEIEEKDLKDIEIILASYSLDLYDGEAYVLFKKGKKLYEVNAGHCSCHGMESQWNPEETTIESIKHRIENGRLGTDIKYGHFNEEDIYENVFAKELREIIDKLEYSE